MSSKMKKIVALTVIIILMSVSEMLSIDSPFNFLRFQSNARSAALSQAVVSLIDDPSALYFNPALLSTVEDKIIQVTFLKHALDINSGNASYIQEFEDYGVFGATVGFTSYGSFDYADKIGNRNRGTFSANDLTFAVSYSNQLDTNLFYGASLKYIYTGIESYSTSAIAIDAGLLYQFPDQRTNLGLSVLHAGTQITKIGNHSDDLPLDVRIGFNHRLRGLPLLFNFSFHHLADPTDNFFSKFKSFSIGGEFYLGQYIQLRVGYDNQIRSLTDASVDKGLTGFSGGVGVLIDDFRFDYGYSSYGSSVNLHRFSLAMNINKFL